jgi:hypothetical protein
MSAKCSYSIQIEGCTITFSCPPGLELNGSNSATCTGDGEWEPDPSWLTCNNSKGKELFYALWHYVMQDGAITAFRPHPPSPFKSTMVHSANKIHYYLTIVVSVVN